jgi:threonine synthase
MNGSMLTVSFLSHLECSRCHATHEAERVQNLCSRCGPLLVRYDPKAVAWAVPPLLGVEDPLLPWDELWPGCRPAP